MSVNYDRVCRLCLSSRGELLPIFPTTSSDESEPPVLANKIKDCVSVQITENDDLPTNVCRKCMDNVNNWHIFKSVCERTQNKLESLLKKDGNQLEEVKIKSEPVSDEAYDDGVVIDGSYPENENAANSAKLQPEGPPILASLGLTPRSDKTCVDPRMDWHRVHAILDMVQDDEIIDSLQTTEECDNMHQSDHDSDSETDLQPTDDCYIDFKNGYLCKNKQLLSKDPKLPSSPVVKISNLRKRKVDSNRHYPWPKNAWQMFLSNDILEIIVASTNDNIQRNGNGFSSSTNVGEIKTLIGILYLHGIMRPTHQKSRDMWHRDYGVPCVTNFMKYERFKFLLQNICFDNEDYDSILQLDVMKRMRKVFEIFALNCRTVLDVQNVGVIDEVIIPVYGPCPFRYSIVKKPLKSGLKLVILVDPSTFYVSNLDIITDPYFGPKQIVQKLVQHLAGTGKTLIMDSWYMSLDLIHALKNEYQLYTIAAINPRNDIIPPLFISKYRNSQTFLTGFLNTDTVITSYMNSESKSVNIITNDPTFYKKGHNRSTTVLSMYKKNQSAVEVVDVLMNYYTTMQHTNDWTLSLFFTLLNIASVNAQVIWSKHNFNNVVKRRLFINELALSLLESDRPMSPVLEIPLRKRLSVLDDDGSGSRYKTRKRCRICVTTTKKDRRTKQFCTKCGQFICKEHSVLTCSMCAT